MTPLFGTDKRTRGKQFSSPSVERRPFLGMTKGKVVLPLRFVLAEEEQQVPPLRCGAEEPV
jgi:hypothetical protein